MRCTYLKTMNPVSYTHLDVYKRQVQDRFLNKIMSTCQFRLFFLQVKEFLDGKASEIKYLSGIVFYA